MIEPTESEDKQAVDRYVEALLTIADEAVNCPDKLIGAPVNAPVRRLDEVKAARKPIVRWQKEEKDTE